MVKNYVLRCVLFFHCLTLFVINSFGQGPDSLLQTANLPNIIEYTLRRQPAVQQSLIDERITDLQIRSRLAEWYPQVNFNYLYQHNFRVQTSIIGGNPVQLGVRNTSALQFGASQFIFDRDVLLAAQTKNDVRLQSRQQTSGTRIDVVATVSKAFYDVLTTERQIQVVNENILRLEESLKFARAQYDAGIVDKTDYKRATIALNNARAAKRNSEEALAAKSAYLKSVMNYPSLQPLNIVYDSMQLRSEIVLDTLARPDYGRRIEYQILQTQRRLLAANVKYNRWSFIPSLSANGAYNFNYLNDQFGKLYSQSYPASFAGITLSFPIFQGGKRRYDIRRAEWQLKRTDLDIVNLQNAIDAEFSAALARYQGALAEFLSLEENVLLAREVYDVIQLQYRNGIKTYLEVITAETDLRTAEINYFNALFQVLSGKVDVQRSLGAIVY